MEMQALVDSMPFATSLGIRLDHAAPEEVRGRLDWTPSAARSAAPCMAGRS